MSEWHRKAAVLSLIFRPSPHAQFRGFLGIISGECVHSNFPAFVQHLIQL